MLLRSIRLKSPSTPSIRMSGDVDELSDPSPLSFREAWSLPGCPELCTAVSPGTMPWRAEEPLETLALRMSLLLMLCTAPVRFIFFCVPYPTTTTSSRAVAV